MSSLIFNQSKQISLLRKFKEQFTHSDFLYKSAAEILYDSTIRIHHKADSNAELFLYGYFGSILPSFQNMTSYVINGFLLEYHDSTALLMEDNIDLEDNKFDHAFSNLSLHFINDLQATLLNYSRIIKNNGIFAATLIADNTMAELRDAFHHADIALYNGAFLRVMPMINSQSILNLLRNAGFINIVLHKEKVELRYNTLFELLIDLRNMGFGNFLMDSKMRITRLFLNTSEKFYFQHHSIDNKLKLSFEILSLSAMNAKIFEI